MALPTLLHVVILGLIGTSSAGLTKPEFRYYNDTEREEFMTGIAKEYPNITYLYSIGKSVEGREMWAMAISENPRDHVPLRPDVKYVGNMHGNEIGNQVLLLHFIHHLVTQYKTNTTIAEFLRSTRVHILPTMNPDGAEKASSFPALGDVKKWSGTSDITLKGQICNGVYGRYNKKGFDLNRNFPDHFVGNATGPRQPETEAIMRWLHTYQFVISANMHGGALVANYPLDSYTNAWSARYSASQDDDVFIHLAKVYSYSHPYMHEGKNCNELGSDAVKFPHGITNGAGWYAIHGGVQDYNYFYAGCFELTLELHCCKFPPVTVLEERWLENKDALINYLMLAHIGVKGTVRSAHNGLELNGASVRVAGRENFESKTTAFGEFWRLLLPGQYTLEVHKYGFKPWSKAITVQAGSPLVLEVKLTEGSGTKGGRSGTGFESNKTRTDDDRTMTDPVTRAPLPDCPVAAPVVNVSLTSNAVKIFSLPGSILLTLLMSTVLLSQR